LWSRIRKTAAYSKNLIDVLIDYFISEEEKVQRENEPLSQAVFNSVFYKYLAVKFTNTILRCKPHNSFWIEDTNKKSAFAQNGKNQYYYPLKTKQMQGLNKVQLIGHLGKDPEMTPLPNSIRLAKVSMATSESFKDKEGKLQTHTEWHSLILWQGHADYALKYLNKGNLVYVEGKLKTRSFEAKADGTKRYVTEIVVERISLLEKSPDQAAPPLEAGPEWNDALPF
jgi:single-strand DNA-binding protein